MNLDSLKVFYVAANNNSFSQTAKDLYISQSSVSLQIKHLEEQWDCLLFERTTKKVSLTPAGEVLYRQVKKLLSVMKETENELQQLKGFVHGDLKVGASLTIGEHILPFILAEYNRQYPKVNMDLKVYNSEQIVEKLHKHEINLGFIESMLSYPALKQVPFAEDELIIIVSPFNKHIDSTKISVEELLHLPFIIREKGSGTRQVMEDALRKNKINPENLNIIMELQQTETIKSAVEAGIGISIISKSAVKKEIQLQTIKQLKIDGLSLHRSFYMIYHEEALSQTSRKLIEMINNHPI